MLVDGLKEMNGGLETLWQLANFDFGKWLDGCVSKSFTNYAKERFWRYKWEKTLASPRYPNHHVRVTFKTKLTDKATDQFPEFKPFVQSTDGSQRVQTDPLGIEFMLQLPKVEDDPGVEAWQSFAADDDEREKKGWNFNKVKKDVLETAKLEKFTETEVDAWNALFKFHENYTTADAVPFSPRVLPVGESATPMTLTGMPIAWSELWVKLRGRCPRHHLASEAFSADVGERTGAENLTRPVTEEEGVDKSLPLPLVNS
eukprot:5939422-Pleurochrysis_carterae.AAC.1